MENTRRNEKWLPIPDYEGIYEVSDRGRVRSLDRFVKNKKGTEIFFPGKGMSTPKRRDGYLTVHLRKNGVRTKHLVHRLVLEAFTGPCPEGWEARHLNDIKEDARLDNLEWGSRRENNLDRTRNGIGYYAERKECRKGHLLVEANLVPNQKRLREGVDTCYACSLAHSTIKIHKELSPFYDQVADLHYENLTGAKREIMWFHKFEHMLI